MRTIVLTVTVVADDDATEASLGEWLTAVLPLRGDTGQISDVLAVAEVPAPGPLTHQLVGGQWLPRPRQWQLVAAATAEVLVAGPLTQPEASREWDRLTAEGRQARIAPVTE